MIAFLLFISAASAERAHVGGYFRVMTRPDLQGGSGKLGYWNLHGRLLNEGPYAALDFKFDVLERSPNKSPWTSIHARMEGGSIGNADSMNGSLSAIRLSQTYVRAGNTFIDNVVWQVGTLESYFGDLGLYDMRPSQIFSDTVGLSARWTGKSAEALIGFGDAGYSIRGDAYNTVFTGGGSLLLKPTQGLELGLAVQARYEHGVRGNQASPYATPEVDYEDFLRGEVVQSWLQENPLRELEFPIPELRSVNSGMLGMYIGFGGKGPLIWNSFYASAEKKHPRSFTMENYQGQEYKIHLSDLTDERYAFLVSNEMTLSLWPGKYDLVWAAIYGKEVDLDNNIAPNENNRDYQSLVVRNQFYINSVVHFLFETSIAREHSANGNMYREHFDSIFENTQGIPDKRGLEMGDTDTRNTWQGKTGFVLNPMGPGIFSRPSIRLLYGVQYSNQNNAFGNGFVESLDQYNDFGNVEQHWHHLLSLETEAWF